MSSSLLKFAVLLLVVVPCSGAPQDSVVATFLETYCAVCHNPQAKAGSLDLTAKAKKDRRIWEKVLAKLNTGQMPPKGALLPSGEEIAVVVQWIETELARTVKEVHHVKDRAEVSSIVCDSSRCF